MYLSSLSPCTLYSPYELPVFMFLPVHFVFEPLLLKTYWFLFPVSELYKLIPVSFNFPFHIHPIAFICGIVIVFCVVVVRFGCGVIGLPVIGLCCDVASRFLPLEFPVQTNTDRAF